MISPNAPRFPTRPPPARPEQRVYRFTLPFPPGVNNLFATNFKTKRRYPTEKYEDWKRLAGDWLALNEPERSLPAGRLAVHFRFYPPKGRRAWDVDGRFKAPIDALVAHYAPDMDDAATRIAVVGGEAMPYDGDPRVEIAVEPFDAWWARTGGGWPPPEAG